MKTLILTVTLAISPLIFAQNPEINVQPGLDLSATLSLFRNIPLMDPAAFQPSQGPVFCRFNDVQQEVGDTQIFTTTYEFFRQTTGGFLKLHLEEVHRITGDLEMMADTKHEVSVVAGKPDDALERSGVATIIAYVLDHREPLVKSQAGELARNLNYTKQGKKRALDYVQPRVAYQLEDGALAKIRIYGLEAIVAEKEKNSLSAIPGGQGNSGKPVENKVLELSVDASGKAIVTLQPAS